VIEWKEIIVHHSLTKDGQTVNSEAIRRYHVETLGWDDVGYHFLVEKVRGLYVVVPGRSLGRVGAHTKGRNEESIGVCLVGNWDEELPPVQALLKLEDLVLGLCSFFSISATRIYPHNEFAPNKSCPGRLFPISSFSHEIFKLQQLNATVKDLLKERVSWRS